MAELDLDQDETPEYVLETIQTLGSLVMKPKLTEKYLRKPPFRYLLDVILETQRQTGFPPMGLWAEAGLDVGQVSQKAEKIKFLNLLIDQVGANLQEIQPMMVLRVQASKIVAGLEPEHTNHLLQCLYWVSLASRTPLEALPAEADPGAEEDLPILPNRAPENSLEKPPEVSPPPAVGDLNFLRTQVSRLDDILLECSSRSPNLWEPPVRSGLPPMVTRVWRAPSGYRQPPPPKALAERAPGQVTLHAPPESRVDPPGVPTFFPAWCRKEMTSWPVFARLAQGAPAPAGAPPPSGMEGLKKAIQEIDQQSEALLAFLGQAPHLWELMWTEGQGWRQKYEAAQLKTEEAVMSGQKLVEALKAEVDQVEQEISEASRALMAAECQNTRTHSQVEHAWLSFLDS